MILFSILFIYTLIFIIFILCYVHVHAKELYRRKKLVDILDEVADTINDIKQKY